MFTRTKSEILLDDEIARQVADLKNLTPDDYETIMTRIDRLQKMKTAETRSSPRVSPDTLVLAATNLLGIAMIIRHEHMNVITSKATGFVMKPK